MKELYKHHIRNGVTS